LLSWTNAAKMVILSVFQQKNGLGIVGVNGLASFPSSLELVEIKEV